MTTHNHVTRAKHMAVRAEHRAQSILNEASDRIASLREDAKAQGQALLNQVKDRGGELLEEAQERGEKALKTSKDWVGENPAQAIGIAFVAGVVAHMWFSRSED